MLRRDDGQPKVSLVGHLRLPLPAEPRTSHHSHRHLVQPSARGDALAASHASQLFR
jgi:hypothetical protein